MSKNIIYIKHLIQCLEDEHELAKEKVEFVKFYIKAGYISVDDAIDLICDYGIIYHPTYDEEEK